MTTPHYRAILAARRRCEINPQAHVGKPLNLRPARSRRWWRLGR